MVYEVLEARKIQVEVISADTSAVLSLQINKWLGEHQDKVIYRIDYQFVPQTNTNYHEFCAYILYGQF